MAIKNYRAAISNIPLPPAVKINTQLNDEGETIPTITAIRVTRYDTFGQASYHDVNSDVDEPSENNIGWPRGWVRNKDER